MNLAISVLLAVAISNVHVRQVSLEARTQPLAAAAMLQGPSIPVAPDQSAGWTYEGSFPVYHHVYRPWKWVPQYYVQWHVEGAGPSVVVGGSSPYDQQRYRFDNMAAQGYKYCDDRGFGCAPSGPMPGFESVPPAMPPQPQFQQPPYQPMQPQFQQPQLQLQMPAWPQANPQLQPRGYGANQLPPHPPYGIMGDNAVVVPGMNARAHNDKPSLSALRVKYQMKETRCSTAR